MAKVRILFVRHGESEGNLTGTFYDDPMGGLTERGKEQARKIGERLKEEFPLGLHTVYCSTWNRARQTCQIALGRAGLLDGQKISYDGNLRERSFVGLVGKKVGSVSSEEAISEKEYRMIWTAGSSQSDKFGIENLLSLKKRIQRFLDKIAEEHPGEKILVISHAGVGLMMKALC